MQRLKNLNFNDTVMTMIVAEEPGLKMNEVKLVQSDMLTIFCEERREYYRVEFVLLVKLSISDN